MLTSRDLRELVACVLACALSVGGLIALQPAERGAANRHLPHSSAPKAAAPAAQAAPPAGPAADEARERAGQAYDKLPLSFEENRGQVDAEVRYVARGRGYTLFLTPTEAVLAFRGAESGTRKASGTPPSERHRLIASRNRKSSVLRMRLAGANPAPAVTGEDVMKARTNYFIGNDPQKWHTDVARYERVKYTQVYPGIDMIYYGERRQLEYDFQVAPGADAGRIVLEFSGVKQAQVERATGELVLKTANGEVRQRKPAAYQEVGGERREVASRYVLRGEREVGVEVGEYDRTKTLTIDPVLTYSTYLGGSDHDTSYDIAVGSAGIVYVTGETFSTDFPTLNPFQEAPGPYTSAAFVTKLDTNASGEDAILYSTFLGGSLGDYGAGITVDPAGIVYVAGEAGSPDFPTLHGQPAVGGGDLFVAKLDTNASGAASLLYSTCIGGSDWDSGGGIAVTSSGIAYLSGFTRSADFPTRNAYQSTQGGENTIDAFVVKLDTNLSGAAALLYGTYLGGRFDDLGGSLAADASGNVYLSGYTRSPDFPTFHELQTYQAGTIDYDAFVAKLDTNASGAASLLYSTYLGGNNWDTAGSIVVDSAGMIYLTGETSSTDFPLLNEYPTPVGPRTAFVTKLDPGAAGAASLLYSTLLGGTYASAGSGIALDSFGKVYVTGYTYAPDFPLLSQCQGHRGETDVFVAKLDTSRAGTASLLNSTCIGGSGFDFGYGIALDSAGNAYVTGETSSADFPTLNGLTINGSGADGFNDGFVVKLAFPYAISGRVTSDGTTGLGGVTVTLGGSLNRTAVTNSAGQYSFTKLLPGGDYTVTPSKSGLSFLPSRRSYADLELAQTGADFRTRPATISGRVTVGTSAGAALGGVTMTLIGGANFTPRTLQTSSYGTYSFGGLPTPGSYRLTPSKANYTFSPAQVALLNLTTSQPGTNFVATLKTYTVGGVVKLGAAGLGGVAVRLESPSPAGFTARTATTSGTGAYSFPNVPAGRSYTVTPVKSGYQFTPASKSLAGLSANQIGVNFSVKVYSISGRVVRAGTTTGIGAVTLTLTSPSPANFAARSAQTTSTGYYTFANVPAGRNYTIKPTKSGFTFSPASRSISNLSANIAAGAATNFTGTGP